MADRLAVYFDSEDEAQRAVPQLRALGVREITVERLEEDDDREAAPFLVGYNTSTASTIPSTGTLPSASGARAADVEFGAGDNGDRDQEGQRNRYLLECEVTSELAPKATEILIEHGAAFKD
ncbi:hypothetical protein DUZ99_05515 [Xylanibacillus composti]|uniref:Uncharacterized protein n=1 Tax=Xylanibacillus composti TaxID=1572762 RepID=A0A8J4H722_9BACL|nr:hypothetical protein [Xylanibacillus composti]MDT9724446.1 hypothetical protein [Xylanibacillus composti]GIQ69708.1 hypothetical protein XYCOK13_25320 [Xylanibacillus composti]